MTAIFDGVVVTLFDGYSPAVRTDWEIATLGPRKILVDAAARGLTYFSLHLYRTTYVDDEEEWPARGFTLLFR